MGESQVIIAVLFATALLMMLAFFLLFFLIRYRTRKNQFIDERDKLKKDFEQTLLLSQIEVQENTFEMLSSELHDNIGQLLVTAKSFLGTTERNLRDPPETLRMAQETLGIANQEVRSLSKMLNKEWLQQFNFIQNLTTEVNRINTMQTLQILLSAPENILLPAEEQLILFRIVQEALQNAVKHSQAENIAINVSNSASSLIVNITDDGKGFDTLLSSTGLGIKNMKHRTQLLGGIMEHSSSSGNGSSVIIKLPVKKSES